MFEKLKRVFMITIKTSSFTLNANDNIEALDTLLKLNNLTKESFAKKTGAKISDIQKAPQWAISYLADLADANLIHLGYVIKDTKTDGILKPIKELEGKISKIKTEKAITAQNPIILNKDIVTEQGAIKVAYIANIEQLLEDFKESIEADV